MIVAIDWGGPMMRCRRPGGAVGRIARVADMPAAGLAFPGTEVVVRRAEGVTPSTRVACPVAPSLGQKETDLGRHGGEFTGKGLLRHSRRTAPTPGPARSAS